MNGLGSNGAVHEARKTTGPSGRRGSSTGIALRLSEEGPEAAEDTRAGAERHDDLMEIPSVFHGDSG
jgi:hypothetical protein